MHNGNYVVLNDRNNGERSTTTDKQPYRVLSDRNNGERSTTMDEER